MVAMSYEVLARKLRPAGFDALVGQDHVVKALRHALDQGRLHHAYLFTGTRGVGKTTIARILAKALNCEQGVSSSPCGECSVCVAVRENRFIDLIEVDAASRTGVDDTRELLDNAQYMPSQGRYKVYLIDEVHMLSTASFNALLKTLEEPPEHVKFLLATTDPKKVPATVLSRCLQFQLKNMSREVITAYLADVLTTESVTFESGALEVIARSAAGSMRDALSLTDQAIAYGEGSLTEFDVTDMLGIVGEQDVESVLEGLRSGDPRQLMQVSATLSEQNTDFAELLGRMAEALHRMAVASATGANDVPLWFSPEEIQLLYQIAIIGGRDLDLAPEPRSGFEMTLLRMLTFAPGSGSTVPPLGSTEAGKNENAGGKKEAGGGPAAPSPSVTGTSAQETATASEAAADTHAEPQEGVDTVAAEAPVSPQPRDEPQKPAAGPEPLGQEQSALPSADPSWYELVAGLPVAGVTRMICENAALLEYALPSIRLCLDEKHETLLSEHQRSQLERAFCEHLGTEVSLQVTLGKPTSETPAQRTSRQAAEKQSAAEKLIEADATVSGILQEFGGRVEEIRPR